MLHLQTTMLSEDTQGAGKGCPLSSVDEADLKVDSKE